MGVPGRPGPCLFPTKYFKSHHCKPRMASCTSCFLARGFLFWAFRRNESPQLLCHFHRGLRISQRAGSKHVWCECQGTHLLSPTLPYLHPPSDCSQHSPVKAEDACLERCTFEGMERMHFAWRDALAWRGCTCSRCHCCHSLCCFDLFTPGSKVDLSMWE